MITERFKTILEELAAAEEDAQKCEEGNASAGRRLRKASMAAIKVCHASVAHLTLAGYFLTPSNTANFPKFLLSDPSDVTNS